MPHLHTWGHEPAPAGQPAIKRRYYRCLDCLSVFTADYTDVRDLPHYENYECSCGGHIENMGDVRMDRIVKSYEASPCDDRCTEARGPVCNCHCGGKNHGTHLTVTVVHDCGPAPRVKTDVDNEAKGKAFRKLYQRALEAWKTKWMWIIEKRNRGWIPRPEWDTYVIASNFRRELTKTGQMKVYSLRQKKLEKFIEKMEVA